MITGSDGDNNSQRQMWADKQSIVKVKKLSVMVTFRGATY